MSECKHIKINIKCFDVRKESPSQTNTVIHSNKVQVFDEYEYIGF